MIMRSLRLGVVIGGQLVEERVFSGAVTFGQSLRCAVSLPLEGLPREHLLFARDQGAFVLHVPSGMSARVASGSDVKLVEGELRLAAGSRGKLAMGDATILFQDVATVVRPKPRLPASLRVHHFDRRLAVIVASSLVVHIGIAAWAWSADLSTTVLGGRDIPASFQQDTIDVSMPDHVERIDPTTNPRQPAVATPVAPQHHIVQPVTSDPQRLAEDASRMASILTGDDGTHGFGGINHRQPGADLARQMDDAANHTVTIGDSDHTSRVDDRARLGTDRGLQIADQALTHEGGAHTTERTGRIQIQPLPGGDEGTTLTAQAVLQKIQTSYLAGLQRCYRLGQNEDAGLEGKIAIELTVDAHGRVTEPSAAGLTPKVDSCVAGFMSS
jgi:hypothetical protein